jgi:hypothetical protein
LLADAIASVTVQTDMSGLPGGTSCKLTSSGAEIACTSGTATVPDVMSAAGSASAGVGSLSIFAAADGPTNFLGRADASASYNYQVYLARGYSGIITGEYTLNVNAGLSPGIYGYTNMSQGSATATYALEEPFYTRNPITLTSMYVAGQPLEIQGSIMGTAIADEEVVYASLSLIGFFDQAGNSIPFTVAPEPATWPVLGLSLVLVWRGKRLR